MLTEKAYFLFATETAPQIFGHFRNFVSAFGCFLLQSLEQFLVDWFAVSASGEFVRIHKCSTHLTNIEFDQVLSRQYTQQGGRRERERESERKNIDELSSFL